MPACPNCGRATMRTRDWACQWCGYPLLSRAYKKIDKTFRELQDERFAASRSSVPEPDLDMEPTPESRAAYEPPPEPTSIAPPPRQERRTPPARPERRASSAPPPAPAPRPELRPEAELPPSPPPVSIAPPRSEPPPELDAPEPALPLAARPTSVPLPPPPEPLPPPPPVALPDLSSVGDGSLLTVDELDALYKADRLAAHSRLTGKTISIRGFVEKVFIRDHIDVRYIMLTGVNKKVVWPVRCTFNKENVIPMSRLAEGHEVTVRGKYDSYGRNIIFKDCALA